MQAIVQNTYGSADVLELEEIDKPVIADDEVLVRVHATSVHPGDWHTMRGEPYLVRLMGFGLLKPKKRIRGTEVAGTVEAVGEEVDQLRPGDEVFGEVGAGAFAEYVGAGADKFVKKPVNLTFEQAAAVPVSALTALQGLRDKGQIEPGQRVLINGASGGVGTFAVQLAKSFGGHVTGVCSTRNVDLVRSIGAADVIDYTQQDFTKADETFDLIIDTVGNRSLSDCRRVLGPEGTFVIVGGQGGRWLGGVDRSIAALVLSRFGGQRLVAFIARANQEDLSTLKDLIEAGDVTPVIDRTYELREIPDAIRYAEEGHARGKVVITVDAEPKNSSPGE